MKKKEKSKYNNDILNKIFSEKQQILKQELSNKEIVFMKLTDLEHKYDNLQIKIDDIINKQNALADSTQKEKEKMIQDKEEGQNLIDKEINNEIKEQITVESSENTIINKNNDVQEEKKEKKEIIIEETKNENNNKNDNINKKNEEEVEDKKQDNKIIFSKNTKIG